MSAIQSNIPTVLIDMPEIVLRLQIANQYSLEELNKMFNVVANKINRGEVIPNPHVAAQMLFPEVFVKPREEYMHRMLRDIAASNSEELFKNETSFSATATTRPPTILAYTGHIHVQPLVEMWEQEQADGYTDADAMDERQGGRSVLGLN